MKLEIDKSKLESAVSYLETQPKVVFDPYPNYDSRVFDALSLLSADVNYQENYEKLADIPISEMTIENVATTLTFISRGERFCDGHIASYIESGTLLELMKRLKEITDEIG